MDELLPTILTSFATTMAVKGAEAPANTFNETWKYVFGPIDSFLIRKNEKRRIDNEKYIQSLTEKVEKIPLEQIQEPKISILGPALEASKFYIEEKEIREMFASLLASSFDSSKNPQLHHSFVEIIKQMSPLDAKNLIKIATIKRCPVVKYSIKSEGGFTRPLKNLVFIPTEIIDESIDNSIFDFDRHATSITNLERLGLIKVDFTSWLTDDSRYSLLENNPLADAYREYIYNKNNNESLDIPRGIIDTSPLGMDFYTVCLSK